MEKVEMLEWELKLPTPTETMRELRRLMDSYIVRAIQNSIPRGEDGKPIPS